MRIHRIATVAAGLSVLAALTAVPATAEEPGEQPNPPSWGLDRIDQRTGTDQLYRYQTRAEKVTAYIIDTGVDADLPDLAGRVVGGKDFVDGDENPDDGNGHGTHLAAIVGGEDFGVAKDVRIMPVRILDDAGAGQIAKMIEGIDWVVANAQQPAVAILGLGGPANQAIDDAVRRLAAVMPVAVPAGGSGSDAGQFSPARVPEAVTVAASDSADGAAENSNFGPSVDLYAPGVRISSPGSDGGTRVLSGTSTAAAHVAGALALYRALHPDATAPQAAQAVVDNATKDVLRAVPGGTPNRLLHTLVENREMSITRD
ncbi:S8 family peptidase [Amycolatopsis suaedae]|uniref:S8 family peptidase n=1 Tax=Amycolatopsis suaedae TaxID=2510978 RepID=A0A4V2EMD8_9PSEU|nr:S8 family peptidase [Amycolatopsis suaedae]RZQ64715.1 S8 family peptidase [Amycolatopsis suaedae]